MDVDDVSWDITGPLNVTDVILDFDAGYPIYNVNDELFFWHTWMMLANCKGFIKCHLYLFYENHRIERTERLNKYLKSLGG